MLHKNTLEYLVFLFIFFQNKVLTRKGKLLVYIIIQVLIPTSHFGYKMQPWEASFDHYFILSRSSK